jgi:hypothetical protein
MVTQLPHRDTHPRTAGRTPGLHFGRLAAVLGAVTVALLSFAGAVPAAFASMIPHPSPGGAYGPVPVGAATVTHLIMTGGTPGWQIALIALGAALVAAAAAVTLDRTVGRRRPVSAVTA